MACRSVGGNCRVGRPRPVLPSHDGENFAAAFGLKLAADEDVRTANDPLDGARLAVRRQLAARCLDISMPFISRGP